MEQTVSKSETARPETGFLYSSLFTGRGSKIPLYSEIKKDIESSDEIYFIISFLKLYGLNLIYEDLKNSAISLAISLELSQQLIVELLNQKPYKELQKYQIRKFVFLTTQRKNAFMQNRISSFVTQDAAPLI